MQACKPKLLWASPAHVAPNPIKLSPLLWVVAVISCGVGVTCAIQKSPLCAAGQNHHIFLAMVPFICNAFIVGHASTDCVWSQLRHWR